MKTPVPFVAVKVVEDPNEIVVSGPAFILVGAAMTMFVAVAVAPLKSATVTLYDPTCKFVKTPVALFCEDGPDSVYE